jgi:hypothetical protein
MNGVAQQPTQVRFRVHAADRPDRAVAEPIGRTHSPGLNQSFEASPRTPASPPPSRLLRGPARSEVNRSGSYRSGPDSATRPALGLAGTLHASCCYQVNPLPPCPASCCYPSGRDHGSMWVPQPCCSSDMAGTSTPYQRGPSAAKRTFVSGRAVNARMPETKISPPATMNIRLTELRVTPARSRPPGCRLPAGPTRSARARRSTAPSGRPPARR